MEFWTLEGIKAAAGAASGASWLARPEQRGTIEGASIDSRTVAPGQVFIARHCVIACDDVRRK